MLPNLGGWEWVIIAVVALILFGGARLANFGKNAGKAIRDFKKETSAAPGVADNVTADDARA
ncbi:MAG: twin-arginine translocase TatA/TatE family subunit [Micropruina glycogenica]